MPEPLILPADAPPETCPECGGDLVEDCKGGWVTTPGTSARPCPTRQKLLGEKLLAETDVPELYRGSTVDGFRVDGLRGAAQLAAARDACRSYVTTFKRHGPERTTRGLLFVGPPGTGKTMLAVAVLQAIVRLYGVRGLFVDFTSVCHEIQASYDDPNASESRILRPLMEAPILVLDELGARRPTPFVQDTLYLVINTRYSAMLPTLFTTNYPLDGGPRPETGKLAAGLDRATGGVRAEPADDSAFDLLSARVGPRIYSRLFEATAQPPLLFDQVGDFRRRT